MLLKYVLQELKKYNVEFDTNITKIKKVDSNIVFEVEDVGTGKPEKKNRQDNKSEIN